MYRMQTFQTDEKKISITGGGNEIALTLLSLTLVGIDQQFFSRLFITTKRKQLETKEKNMYHPPNNFC